MADDPVIAKAIEQITHHDTEAANHVAEATRLKTFINEYDKLAGREPRYGDVTAPAVPTSAAAAAIITPRKTWEAGEFFGKPFATAAKTILVARFEAVGKPAPASVDDIRDSLLQGTYDFGTTNAEQQKQGIRISLGKNSGVFVKLPNTDLFGLVEWYGGRPRRQRVRLNDQAAEAPTDSADAAEPGAESESQERAAA